MLFNFEATQHHVGSCRVMRMRCQDECGRVDRHLFFLFFRVPVAARKWNSECAEFAWTVASDLNNIQILSTYQPSYPPLDLNCMYTNWLADVNHYLVGDAINFDC